MSQSYTNTEPIKIYREGKLDRRDWFTQQAKIAIRQQLTRLESASESIFVDHRLPQ